jgi:hypothetical protein
LERIRRFILTLRDRLPELAEEAVDVGRRLERGVRICPQSTANQQQTASEDFVLHPLTHRRALRLPSWSFLRTLGSMEVHFAPDLQAKIDQLVSEAGRPSDKLLADAMAGYVSELAETREMLVSRYDDLKSGRVKAHRRRSPL